MEDNSVAPDRFILGCHVVHVASGRAGGTAHAIFYIKPC